MLGGPVADSNRLYSCESERLMHDVSNKAINSIMKKCGLRACGQGASMPDGIIKQITLSFDIKKKCDKKGLRMLLVNAAEILVEQVNSNKQIQKYLFDPPFNFKNVQIIIFCSDEKGFEPVDPLISTAQFARGTLTYLTVDPKDSYKYKNEYEETYEEALKLVNEN